MAVSLLYNTTILVIILNSLRKRSKNVKTASKTNSGTMYLLRVVVSLSMLLGLTWVFGILIVLVDNIVLQYIFAILNTFQGFLIFILHTVRAKEVRKEWTSAWSSRRPSTSLTFTNLRRRSTGADSTGGGTLSRFRRMKRPDYDAGDYSSRTSSMARSTHMSTLPRNGKSNGMHSMASGTSLQDYVSPPVSPPPYDLKMTSIGSSESTQKVASLPEQETKLHRSDSVPSFADFSWLQDVWANEEATDNDDSGYHRNDILVAHL